MEIPYLLDALDTYIGCWVCGALCRLDSDIRLKGVDERAPCLIDGTCMIQLTSGVESSNQAGAGQLISSKQVSPRLASPDEL